MNIRKVLLATTAVAFVLAQVAQASATAGGPGGGGVVAGGVPGVGGSGAGAVVGPIFICVGVGIMPAALVANFRDNRELTAPEAWTCGLLFWFSQPVHNPNLKSGRYHKRKH